MGPVGSARARASSPDRYGDVPYSVRRAESRRLCRHRQRHQSAQHPLLRQRPDEAALQLVKSGRTVASSSITCTFEPTTSPRVLLVPIMPDGYSAQQLNQMKSTVDANLADYRYRIYPGGLKPYLVG